MTRSQDSRPRLDDRLIVYEPRHGRLSANLRELWSYRELLYFLSWRDFLIRYKQAVFGVAWAVFQPILAMVVFTIVFNQVIGVQSPDPNVPYAVFSFAGLLPWIFFSGGITRAGASLVTNSSLLTKVYFPRVLIPSSAVLAGVVDLGISLLVLLFLMAAYGIAPTTNILFLPFFVILGIAAALGVSLWLSSLNVLYRDVQYVIPFLVQIWLFMSPVIYSSASVPSGVLRVLFALNPMTAVIDGFRWALLNVQPTSELWLSVAVNGVILVGGAIFFFRMERMFADVV